MGNAMGSQSDWLAYTSQNDETDGGCSLLFIAGSTTHGGIRWFVRNDPIAVVNPSPAFSEVFTFGPGETVRLSHRVIIIDRILERDELEALADEHALSPTQGMRPCQ